MAVRVPMQPLWISALTQFNDKSMTPATRVAPFCCTSPAHPTASGRLVLAPFPFCRPSLPKTPTGIHTHPKPKLNFPVHAPRGPKS